MFLKKFIYVNWGNIPATEFEFGPINLLSGGNGSGKTTAADAIQNHHDGSARYLVPLQPRSGRSYPTWVAVKTCVPWPLMF